MGVIQKVDEDFDATKKSMGFFAQRLAKVEERITHADSGKFPAAPLHAVIFRTGTRR
jgi:hypothetical protein